MIDCVVFEFHVGFLVNNIIIFHVANWLFLVSYEKNSRVPNPEKKCLNPKLIACCRIICQKWFWGRYTQIQVTHFAWDPELGKSKVVVAGPQSKFAINGILANTNTTSEKKNHGESSTRFRRNNHIYKTQIWVKPR